SRCDGAEGQWHTEQIPGRARRDAGRFQARVRTPSRRGSARRRNLPRHLPFLGQSHAAETRQGSFPPRPRRREGGLSRDAAAGAELTSIRDDLRNRRLPGWSLYENVSRETFLVQENEMRIAGEDLSCK